MRNLTEQFFTCSHCDETFIATRTAKFCSSRCRTAAHRAKKKPTLLMALVENNNTDLIEDWNIVRQLSTYAERMIKEIYNKHGYEPAMWAIIAAYATYANTDIKTEADYQTEETAEAERIAASLAATGG